MKLAWLAARKSKDPSTKVGCVLVDDDNNIVSTGFNGFPRKVMEYEVRMERPQKYDWSCHAEENAVAGAARKGAKTLGCVAYVTAAPCHMCTRMLIQAGIKFIIHGDQQFKLDQKAGVAKAMLLEAGVGIYGPMSSV
jgi:dCMP deaminase